MNAPVRIAIDWKRRSLVRDGVSARLTPKALFIVESLLDAEREGLVLSSADIACAIWGDRLPDDVKSSRFKVHLCHARTALAKLDATIRVIRDGGRRRIDCARLHLIQFERAAP